MNFYTRKTKLEDFIKKDEGYVLGDDENTFLKFAKKYPYSANYRPRWSSQNKMINRLGRFEALMRKYDVSSPKNMEEKLVRLEELEKKETPMKPIRHSNNYYRCENCDGLFQNYHYQNYCPNCGQRLDWEVKK